MAAVFKSILGAGALSIALLASSGTADAWGWRTYYSDYYYYSDPYYYDYYVVDPYPVEYVYIEPAPVVTYDYRPAPWTPEWYDYCASKYRSFDPASGTFQPYHGHRRLCR